MAQEPDGPSPSSPGFDAPWVRAALEGDRLAYGRLYDRYAATIRAICHDATSDLNEAQDLCQETFLRAYRQLNALREPERFGGWLYGIAKMVCREWRRKAMRERGRRGELVMEPAAPPDLSPAEDESTHLLDAIALLPERERVALHLFYLQERPLEDAQAMLGLSRSGFYRVLERGRERLKRALSRPRELTP